MSPALPEGFELMPDLVVREVIEQKGFIIAYKCEDRTLDATVLLREFFSPELATRLDDHSVRPVVTTGSEAKIDDAAYPIIQLSDTVIVRGHPGGDRSPVALFEWRLRRFIEEAGLLAKLNHPAIARVFRAFRHNGTGYMTLQWITGRTLTREVQSREMRQDDLDTIAEPLLGALELLHSHGLIHRNLQPDNIIVRTDTGTPVLTEFGEASEPVTLSRVTAAFTPTYGAFEEYTSDTSQIGPWTDIYGLATCLYYAILKRPPQSALERMTLDEPSATLEQQVAKGLFRASFLRAIDHGLQLRPGARPQTIKAWRPELLRGSRAVSLPRQQIFISYRRADTAVLSARVYDHLSQVFGGERVFFDVDTIPAGVDFRAHIAQCMDMTAVCVVIVGRHWHQRPWRARFRLWDDAVDHVHVEIGLALEAEIPIVPVLVDGAPMPSPAQLPMALAPFCNSNALHLRTASMREDLERLAVFVAQHAKRGETT